mmetsp:Transcript_33846/g.46392  ORF Transcript_33846/g.46392 Transcript_33846/m.46392 type:complete len:1310 (+) Transcript_33846:70-3999(+)
MISTYLAVIFLGLRPLVQCYQFVVTTPPTSRDVYKNPYSNVSIWNLPIGNGANYVAAGITSSISTGIDGEAMVLLLDPTQPPTNIYYSSAGWSAASRCDVDVINRVLINAPFPPGLILPDTPRKNYQTAFVMADRVTIRQGLPLAHCSTTQSPTLFNLIDPAYTYAVTITETPSILGPGTYGVHGNTGLSGLGGTIRLGEFIPDAQGIIQPVRHALKANIRASQYFFKGMTASTCFKWPAIICGGYSSYTGTNQYLSAGSLLALSSAYDITNIGLVSEPGKALAWTLQNYGVYLVDDSGWDAFALITELNSAADYKNTFRTAYGFDFFAAPGNENVWAKDVRKLFSLLSIITNWNAATYNTVKASKGTLGVGGGAPRQPWAPPITPLLIPPTSASTVKPSPVPAKMPTFSPGQTMSPSSKQPQVPSSTSFVVTPPPATRDVYKQPFSNISIWNLPIGASATYTPAGITALTDTTSVAVDPEIILLDYTQPMTNIYYSSAGWGANSRCVADSPLKLILQAPYPPGFFIPDQPRQNYPASFLMPDQVTIRQVQPIAHCSTSQPITVIEATDPAWIHHTNVGRTSVKVTESPNIFGPGFYGAHGGSGLSGFGGAIRIGEFLPDAQGFIKPVRHALKTNLEAGKYFYKSSDMTIYDCYKWPAIKCDGDYFPTAYGGTNPALRPGALLAIPPNYDIFQMGLTSEPGKAIAWTMQNYGVYVVDDAGWDAIYLETELNPTVDYLDAFYAAYGFTFIGREKTENLFTRDMRRLFSHLSVVTNWDAANYAVVAASNGALGVGGGAARQPWAPPFASLIKKPTSKSTSSPSAVPAKPPSFSPGYIMPTAAPIYMPTKAPTTSQFVVSPAPATRNVYKSPFSNISIWNLPIGAGATYAATGITITVNSGVGAEPEVLLLDANQPVTNIYYSSAAWTAASRCDPDSPLQLYLQAPFPPGFIVADSLSDRHNYPATFIMSDKVTLRQGLPLAHCSTDKSPTLLAVSDPANPSHAALFAATAGGVTESPSIYGPGFYGAHASSGLSAIGGTIRIGEFMPDSQGIIRPVRHALKANIQAAKYFYKAVGMTALTCFKWPAVKCSYGYANQYAGTNQFLSPGSLLALLPSYDINNMGLVSEPGKALAWTLQNYGVYLVDDSGWDAVVFETELSPSGDYRDAFFAAYGFAFFAAPGNENVWVKDVRKLFSLLSVVKNWDAAMYNTVTASQGTLGVGGGAPRQPWAAPITQLLVSKPPTAQPVAAKSTAPTPSKSPSVSPTAVPATTKPSSTKPTTTWKPSSIKPSATPASMKPSSLKPTRKPTVTPA